VKAEPLCGPIILTEREREREGERGRERERERVRTGKDIHAS
jgi:hypothetical protein